MIAHFKEIADVSEALKCFFGFDALRHGQDEVLDAIMAGRDALAIMPTGGGKSLCYQLPALCRPGLVVVVSPLIALMKDQVDALVLRDIPAAALHSGLSSEEYRQVLSDFHRGALKILYVAPERFSQEGFMRALCERGVSLLAIDEAHCLSQWGHDFRPDYLRLGRVREALGFPQTVALTATATQQVRDDILTCLNLNDPAITISGFERKNLDLAIVHCAKKDDKFIRIRALMERWKTGIIYCSTRKNVTKVFEEIQSYAGCSVVAYHAGMTDEERAFSQDAFISRRADVVVATNAFGMGIDRADVRFVAHFEIPGSVEAFYQEAGRAGRDGERSVCELLFNHADLRTQEFFFEGSNPSWELLRSLYQFLRASVDDDSHELIMTVDEIAQQMGKIGSTAKAVNSMALGSALSLLIHADAIARFDVPGKRAKGTRVLDMSRNFEMLDINREGLDAKARRDHVKIETMTRFAYAESCRHEWILRYFGETGAKPCGHCDRCVIAVPDGAQELSGEMRDLVRKALSGVARASRRSEDGAWQGIYGRGKIMDMLRGSKGANMHAGLTGLSTYGLLSSLSDAQMKGLFSALRDVAYLRTEGGEMPLLTLSEKGQAVMLGREPAVMATGWYHASTSKRSSPRSTQLRSSSGYSTQVRMQVDESMEQGRMDKELYERLAELRRDIASYQNMPIYRVMNTETLRTMARVKPRTLDDACQIKGIGPAIREKYLRSFIELILDYEGC